MSMEFFAWPWAEGFFGPDTRKFLYSHLAGALTFIPYGTMVDHFQHIVYEKPDMTPAERNDAWKELTAIYTPWLKMDDSDLPFYTEGRRWQRQSHIYVNPFYYIDYCLAQTVSLEFWAMIQKDKDNAYRRSCRIHRGRNRSGGRGVPAASFPPPLQDAGHVKAVQPLLRRGAHAPQAALVEGTLQPGVLQQLGKRAAAAG